MLAGSLRDYGAGHALNLALSQMLVRDLPLENVHLGEQAVNRLAGKTFFTRRKGLREKAVFVAGPPSDRDR
ncbi:hypothetical protein [Paraburkholderia sp. GAS448]|uniref:hypothetical protein n=1 Tax=Paraburkholderia sp. GAS448 TaxID=3035136 RepID=UPI003D1DED55